MSLRAFSVPDFSCYGWIDVNDYEYYEPLTLEEVSYLTWRFKQMNIPSGSLYANYTSEPEVGTPINRTTDFTDLSNTEPPPPEGTSVTPFLRGTVHLQQSNDVLNGVLSYWNTPEEIELLPMEPYLEICGTTTNRFVTDPSTSMGVGAQFGGVGGYTEMYDGEKVEGDKSNFLGYGVKFNTFVAYSGIVALDVSQVSYGSYALDKTYAPEPFSFDPLTWWGPYWFGDSIEARPPSTVGTSTDIAGIKLIKATWEHTLNGSGGNTSVTFTCEVPDSLSVDFFKSDEFTVL